MNAQQLKNSILQEAIQGRLVPQAPNDEPASVLLDKIRKEKERLVKEGKLKKKDLEETPIAEDEKPFEIPKGWVWVRWGMLGKYKKGPFGSSLTKSMFVPESDDAVKVYEQKNAIQKDFSLGDYYISKEKYETMKGFTVNPGDIIVSCAGTIGETYLLPQDAPVGIINQALMRARLHLDSIIPYWLLNFRYILLIENKLKGSGSAIKNIPPFEVLKAMPVSLPPLAEQRRIVAKIEELLPKVEEYGKAQEALDKLNNEFPERLKKSILQEAIQGRLVPQDPNDEPASVLLDIIRKEKVKLVKEGKLKKSYLKESPLLDEEKPFSIPSTWEWCKLGWIGDWGAGATPAKGNPEFYNNGTIPWLRTGELNYDYVYDSEIKVTKKALEKCSLRICQVGDVLVAMYGATIGKVAIAGIELTTNQACCACTPFYVYNKYLLYFLMASKQRFIDMGEGGAQPNISREKIVAFPFPLPPLAEQHRIVAKIEELFGVINIQ